MVGSESPSLWVFERRCSVVRTRRRAIHVARARLSLPRTVLTTEQRRSNKHRSLAARDTPTALSAWPRSRHRTDRSTCHQPGNTLLRWRITRVFRPDCSERSVAPVRLRFQCRCLVGRTVRGRDAEHERHGWLFCVSCQQDTGTETPTMQRRVLTARHRQEDPAQSAVSSAAAAPVRACSSDRRCGARPVRSAV